MDGVTVEVLSLEKYKSEVHRTLLSKLDLEKLSHVESGQARQVVAGVVSEIIGKQAMPLSLAEQEKIKADLLAGAIA
jgi:pilus assembly protein CpaF